MSALKSDELQELSLVMHDMEMALRALPDIHPDHFNYLQMGNALPLLHFHGVPRYQSDRTWQGEFYRDATWGHPPVWTYTEVSVDMLQRLKSNILSVLSHSV